MSHEIEYGGRERNERKMYGEEEGTRRGGNHMEKTRETERVSTRVRENENERERDRERERTKRTVLLHLPEPGAGYTAVQTVFSPLNRSN